MKNWKEDFLKEIKEISDKKNLKDYDAFVFWYLKARENMSEEEISESITNKCRDLGVDAVIIDKNMRIIKIIQSKFTESIGESAFNKDELNKLEKIYYYLKGQDDYTKLSDYSNRTLKDRLDKSIKLIKEEDYSIILQFITTHKKNPNSAVYHREEIPLDIITSEDIARIYNNWISGATPELGEITLKYEDILNGPQKEIKSFIVNFNVLEFKELYQRHKDKLFSKNIRIFYGEKPKANKNMKDTLNTNPTNFWYFNNGVTLLSERVRIDRDNKKISLLNPQIINGCQTVSTLGSFDRVLTEDAFLFGKIIEVSDTIINQDLIDGIIEANNRQTKVDEIMLRSNHPLQVKLQRQLEELSFYYERKKGQYKAESIKNKISKMEKIDNVFLIKSNIAIIKFPHLSHENVGDLFSTHFGDIFKEDKSYLDYLIPYLVWREICQTGKHYGKATRKQFNKLASFHVLRIIYDNNSDLKNNLKMNVLYKKIDHVDPYHKFNLDESVIKQLLELTYTKFKQSKFKELASGQRDFFKNKETYKVISDTIPKYLKNKIANLFD